MASETADAIVIGAGVIGLAVARQLALAGREVLLMEANSSIGMETSSRNSGVIHAGIYYPPGSLKARCCVRGKQLLYDYCKKKARLPFTLRKTHHRKQCKPAGAAESITAQCNQLGS